MGLKLDRSEVAEIARYQGSNAQTTAPLKVSTLLYAIAMKDGLEQISHLFPMVLTSSGCKFAQCATKATITKVHSFFYSL